MATTVPHDYTQFDQKLISCIEAGKSTAAILSIVLKLDAQPMMAARGEEFRVVDRRLQALRKKGVINWVRVGRNVTWQLTKKAA